MAEYIERNAALRTLTLHDCDSAGAKIAIRNLPASDVAPVVHGRWNGSICTHCKLPWNYNMVQDGDDCGYMDPMPDFCPNCGAKMDKEYNDGV